MSLEQDLKSSAQVWGGKEAQQPEDSPPAYSGTDPEPSQRPDLPARPSQRRSVPREPYNPVRAIAKWARVPWGRYVVPDAVVSDDRTTITTSNTTFLTSQQALIRLLADQAELPPVPTIRIAGNHMDGTSPYNKIDFDITINLGTLLDLSRPARWHNKPAQVVPLPNPNGRAPASSAVSGNNTVQIEAFARQFLRDKSDRKSFVLNRTIENLPTDVIEGLIRNLIASLNYRGRLNVTFPVQCGQLIIQKKPAGTGAAVGGWFMNVLGLSPDVKYETLERIWEIGYTSIPGGSNIDDDVDEDNNGNGPSNSQGEASLLIKEWWNAWAPVIRDAVLLKRQGKVGVEDWMEAQMGWRPKPITHDWGVDRG